MDTLNFRYPTFPILGILLVMLLWHAQGAEGKGDFKNSATRAFYENLSSDQTLSTDLRISYLDSLLLQTPRKEHPLLMMKRAQILAEGSRYAEAYRQFNLTLQDLPKDSVRLRLLILHDMARNAYYASHYRESSKHSLDLLRAEKPDTLLWLDIEALSILDAMDNCNGKNHLGRPYYKIMEECLRQLERSRAHPEVIRKARNRILISKATEESDLHKALDLYMEAKSTETDSALIDGIINNIGTLHYRLGEYKKSRPYFERVLRSHRAGTARRFAVLNYIGSFINVEDGPGADSALMRYMPLLNELDGTPMEWKKFNILYNVHLVNGRKQEGLPYLERAVELLDSLHSPENEMLFAGTSNELSELLLERKYGSQIRSSRNKTIGICVLSALLVVVAGALWFYLRKVRRKASEAGNMAASLEETLTRHSEERKEIDRTLQMRGQELASLKLRNEMLRKALDSIMADMNRLGSPRSELANKVKETVKGLAGAEKSFNPRSVTLENVNQAFFDKLYKEHPELTNAERDMCAYALMGLQTKEIATLTNRSVKTVNNIRHNLRKKLGIQVTDTTEAYMRKLSASATGEDLSPPPVEELSVEEPEEV